MNTVIKDEKGAAGCFFVVDLQDHTRIQSVQRPAGTALTTRGSKHRLQALHAGIGDHGAVVGAVFGARVEHFHP